MFSQATGLDETVFLMVTSLYLVTVQAQATTLLLLLVPVCVCVLVISVSQGFSAEAKAPAEDFPFWLIPLKLPRLDPDRLR